MKKAGEINILPLTIKNVKGNLKFLGKKNISVLFYKHLLWGRIFKKEVLQPRKNYFDKYDLCPVDVVKIKEGILLIYFVKKVSALGAAVFDVKDPEKVIWRSANPIWQEKGKFTPLSIKKYGDKLTVYFKNSNGKIGELEFSLGEIFGKKRMKPILERSHKNPIIKPNPKNNWESQYVFNPAAVLLEDKVHLLYRAVGNDWVSVVGYSNSKDGINFSGKCKHPAYIPMNAHEVRKDPSAPISYHFTSGGGYGGCEDPRLTRIDDKLYMVYVAFNGCEPPRVALTSIKVDDFLNKKWNWQPSVLISQPGQANKNWVLFPEKIKGKYAIMHSISPKISIEYLDNLDFDGKKFIKSKYYPKAKGKGWDSWVRGVGPTPLKTKDGWLVLYHAMDHRDPGKYKLGAMLLDLKNPSKVLYKAKAPILAPDECYENEGFKAGVVYACGAVIMDKKLYIYYGAADTVVCVATVPLSDFMRKLKNEEKPKLKFLRHVKK